MHHKLDQLTIELERFYGAPVQIEIGRVVDEEYFNPAILSLNKVADNIIIHPLLKSPYGELQHRPCEVIPLPTNNPEIQHDLGLIKGKYNHSINQVNEKINSIDHISNFASYLKRDFFEDLINHLGKKYPLGETEIIAAPGSTEQWPTIGGVLADFDEWKKERTDIYNEALDYLQEKNALFRHHRLTATLSGVYISKHTDDISDFNLNKLLLIKKIADVKIQLLDEPDE